MNPYHDAHFFSFFSILLQRLVGFLTGKLSFSSLASDEIQLIVLCLVGLSAATVGLFLVLRKSTMLANALSHTILVGIVIAYVFLLPFVQFQDGTQEAFFPTSILLVAAFFTALLTTFLAELLTQTLDLQKDASIGLVFTTLFALGILLVTLLSKNAHIGIEVVMGNADALHPDDIPFVGSIALVNLLLLFVFFKEYVLTTFDPETARTQGFHPRFYHYLLMMQAAMVIIGGFRAVGVLLILAFITVPPLLGRLFCHRIVPLLFVSTGIVWLAVFCGVALSRHLFSTAGLALSTGGIIVSLLGIFYGCASLVSHLATSITTTAKSLLPYDSTEGDGQHRS